MKRYFQNVIYVKADDANHLFYKFVKHCVERQVDWTTVAKKVVGPALCSLARLFWTGYPPYRENL